MEGRLENMFNGGISFGSKGKKQMFYRAQKKKSWADAAGENVTFFWGWVLVVKFRGPFFNG